MRSPEGKTLLDMPWTNGVMSGWAGTAFIDCLVNFGQNQVVTRQCSQLLGDQAVASSSVFGDDDQITATSYVAAVLIIWAYGQLGLTVNRKKTFISWSTDEYLRIFSDEAKANVSGYPGRLLGSITWSAPGSGRPSPDALLDNWVKLADRGALPEAVLHHATQDIAAAMHWSPAGARAWITTPAPVGGGGYLPRHFGPWMRLVRSTKISGDDHVTYTKPLLELVNAWDTDIRDAIDKRFLTRAVVTDFKLVPVQVYVDTRVALARKPRIPYPVQLRDDLPSSFRPEAFARKVRRDGIDSAMEWLDPESQYWAILLQKRWSKNLFLAWLLTQLPSPVSHPYPFSVAYMSLRLPTVESMILQQLPSRASMRDYVSRAIAMQEAVIDEFIQERVIVAV
jgi:hypothetical protein